LPPQSKIAAFLRNTLAPMKSSWTAPAMPSDDGAFGFPKTPAFQMEKQGALRFPSRRDKHQRF
jgi:hypothetical protein